MATIQVNLSDVGDTIPPVEAGIYHCNVAACDLETTDDGKPQVVVQLKITNDGPMKDRMIFDRINITDERGKVSLRRLWKSGGLTPTDAPDTSDIVGKTVQLRAVQKPGKGDNVGKTYTNVAEYLF